MNGYLKKIELAYKVEIAVFSAMVIFLLCYFAFYRGVSCDEREHTYASFMFYRGFLPYKDFFEHHHPLLWFLSYPLLYFFHNSGYIWYVLRAFMLVVLGAECFFVVKICRLFSLDRLFSLLAVLFFLSSECVLSSGVEFRPDNLMMLFGLAGVYYWLCFVKYRWQSALNLSFLMFFLSFLALQKAVIIILPVAGVSLFLACRGKMPWRAVGKALIFPAFFTICFVGFWYYAGALRDYFELNFVLNLMQRFEFSFEIYGTLYCWFGVGGAVGILFFVRDVLLKVLAVLCLATFFLLQIVFYTPWIQYWLPVYPYFALICAYWIVKLKNVLGRFIILSCVLGGYVFFFNNMLALRASFVPLAHNVFFSSQVLGEVDEDELIIGNNVTLGGLRFEAMGYYWFERGYTALLDYRRFHRRKWPDKEKVIKLIKPKVIVKGSQRVCLREDDFAFSFDSCYYTEGLYYQDFLDENYYDRGFVYVRKS
ncbi:MAG: hypothetical protein J6J35_03055 [Alphaproteobacteria bacterium]|nr:hypothetical protein [Alphaproteobacteria bacterium]